MDCGIYEIKNITTNQIYIGSSVYIKHRKNSHFSQLRRGVHSNKKLQNSYNKYGEDSFLFSTIKYCSYEVLREEEQTYINMYKPYFNASYKTTGGPNGRLSDMIIIDIFTMVFNDRMCKKAIKNKYNISTSELSSILNRKRYPYVEIPPFIESKVKELKGFRYLHKIDEVLSYKEIGEIMYLLPKYSKSSIANKYNVRRSMIDSLAKTNIYEGKYIITAPDSEEGLSVYTGSNKPVNLSAQFSEDNVCTFCSFAEARREGFSKGAIKKAINKGSLYKGALWQYLV